MPRGYKKSTTSKRKSLIKGRKKNVVNPNMASAETDQSHDGTSDSQQSSKSSEEKINKKKKGKETSMKSTSRVEFVEEDQIIEMEVEDEDLETFTSDQESSGDEDQEVSFNGSRRSENEDEIDDEEEEIEEMEENNEEIDMEQKVKQTALRNRNQNRRLISERTDLDDSHHLPMTNSFSEEWKNEIIGQAIGQAVAQVKDIFNKSGFLETANLLQKQLDQNKSNVEDTGESSQMVNKTNNPQLVQMVVVEATDKRGQKRHIPSAVISKGKGFMQPRISGNKAIQTTGKNKSSEGVEKRSSNSDITIYENAVVDATKDKRVSSSSEEETDTSGENFDLIDNFISDQRQQFECRSLAEMEEINQPSTSGYRGPKSRKQGEDRTYPGEMQSRVAEADEVADDLIKKAELSRAKIFGVPGENFNCNQISRVIEQLPNLAIEERIGNDYIHSALVDENYLMLGNHVDASMKDKIISGEYVDLVKLLPRDRVMSSDEPQKIELVTKEGQMFWMPVVDSNKITGYNRWDQAFRVYSNIYCKEYPHRASELLQYNHLIQTASTSYIWENVYHYDIDFHLHLAMFPKRRWSIILQQAWMVRLKDRIRFSHDHRHNVVSYGGHSNANSQSKNDDGWGNLCKRFNRGRCSYGPGCRFEHRCKYCKKFGHGMHICCKLKNDKNNAANAKSSTVTQESSSTTKNGN